MTTVIVTRPKQQAEALCKLLQQQSIQTILLPLIEIKPLILTNEHIGHLESASAKADWLIFISVNAVNYAFKALGTKLEKLCQTTRLAAIGQSTANALATHGCKVNATPSQGFNSEALLALPEFQDLKGQRIVCIRGQGGRELLAETFRARGANVEYLEVYQRISADLQPDALRKLIENNNVDYITISSGEILTSLAQKLNTEQLRSRVLEIPLIVISERLLQQAKSLGFKHIALSDGPSDSAVVKKIIRLVSGE